MIRKIAIAALLAGTAFVGVSASAAPIIYTVNQVIGAGGVTGTITTDGTVGTLAAVNITAWNLLLTGNSGATFNLVNGSSGVEVGNISDPFNPNAGNADLTADATNIYFNYSGTDGGYLGFQTLPFYGGQNYWCNASFNNNFDCAQGKSVVPVLFSSPTSIYQAATGNQIIASVVGTNGGVPEPATWAMMVIGIGVIGATMRRQKATVRVRYA